MVGRRVTFPAESTLSSVHVTKMLYYLTELTVGHLSSEFRRTILCTTVYTRVQVERVYKSNPIFEAKNTTFLEKV